MSGREQEFGKNDRMAVTNVHLAAFGCIWILRERNGIPLPHSIIEEKTCVKNVDHFPVLFLVYPFLTHESAGYFMFRDRYQFVHTVQPIFEDDSWLIYRRKKLSSGGHNFLLYRRLL